ncbi:MAG: hypothetical protein OHK0023_02780 [Anaerolineae bacterium]
MNSFRRRFVIALGLVVLSRLLTSLAAASTAPRDINMALSLTWEVGAAQPLEDGVGWRVTTETGYEVWLEEGYLVSYSVQLIECPHEHAWLGVEIVAKAGHGEENDPTLIKTSTLEALHLPVTTALGTVTGSEPSYCEAHYLVARADKSAVEGFSEPDMQATSLYLRGKYRRIGEEQFTPFEARTNLANGTIGALQDGLNQPMPLAQAGTVRVVRRLSRIFDRVDFAAMDSATIAKSALWMLIADTHFVATTP